MNIPPGIDRLPLDDGTYRYRVRIRIKGHKPVSKNFKSLTMPSSGSGSLKAKSKRDSTSAFRKLINIPSPTPSVVIERRSSPIKPTMEKT